MWPFKSYQAPPTNTALWMPIPSAGKQRSLTSGSLEAGDCEAPIVVGPWICGGAFWPSRKRR